MEFDDLKNAWAAHGAILERSLAIDERLLREVLLRKVRVAMAPHVIWRALEVVFGITSLVLVMPVLVAHLGEPRYMLVGGALGVFTVGMTALCAYLLFKSLMIDYAGAVTTIQRDLEHIRIAEYRVLKWAVLGGVVAWLPAALTLFEAWTGVDALARVEPAWLVSNLVFGLVLLLFAHVLSRRYVEPSDRGPGAHRLMEALSGRALRLAATHLDELARFERDEPPAR
jgi:hypothetical protein